MFRTDGLGATTGKRMMQESTQVDALGKMNPQTPLKLAYPWDDKRHHTTDASERSYAQASSETSELRNFTAQLSTNTNDGHKHPHSTPNDVAATRVKYTPRVSVTDSMLQEIREESSTFGEEESADESDLVISFDTRRRASHVTPPRTHHTTTVVEVEEVAETNDAANVLVQLLHQPRHQEGKQQAKKKSPEAHNGERVDPVSSAPAAEPAGSNNNNNNTKSYNRVFVLNINRWFKKSELVLLRDTVDHHTYARHIVRGVPKLDDDAADSPEDEHEMDRWFSPGLSQLQVKFWDVILGCHRLRKNCGSLRFETLIQLHALRYQKATKEDRPKILSIVARTIKNAGGRFLREDHKGSDVWVELRKDEITDEIERTMTRIIKRESQQREKRQRKVKAGTSEGMPRKRKAVVPSATEVMRGMKKFCVAPPTGLSVYVGKESARKSLGATTALVEVGAAGWDRARSLQL